MSHLRSLPVPETVIVDYDAGNLRSVQRACAEVGLAAEISADPARLRRADRIIFPGVGQAGSAMATLNRTGLADALRQVPNIDAFKKRGVDQVSKQFQAELQELQTQIKSFISRAAETQKVYQAAFKFEPLVGEIYHLYEGEKGNFLSLVSPSEWNAKHLGSFRLTSDYEWERQ